jgi:pyruvate,water dikinase
LDRIEDIFFLDIGSVWEILAGSRWREIKTEAKFNKVSFENEVGIPGRYLRRGTSFDDVQNIRTKKHHHNGRIIAGQPVSSGFHEGKIVVMEDMNTDPQIDKGDVLVTKYIDPGQTHLFLMAGALVLEVGGLLSHGAILAREFNIPTVAGVKNATEIFKDGQRAAIDGTKGTATILTERV